MGPYLYRFSGDEHPLNRAAQCENQGLTQAKSWQVMAKLHKMGSFCDLINTPRGAFSVKMEMERRISQDFINLNDPEWMSYHHKWGVDHENWRLNQAKIADLIITLSTNKLNY